jgi:hypothetical protein
MALSRPERGAENLLLNCAGARPGHRLLIATEPPEYGYFDQDAAPCIASVARRLGLSVDTVDVGFNPDNPHLSPDLLHRFEAADIILFLARLGDQLRFSDMPPGKTIIVSFAVRQELLGSGFSTGHYAAFLALKSEVNTLLAGAREVRLTCPDGTEVTGKPEMDLSKRGDTTIRRFPMSVFTPVPAHSFSGRVAMRFLTGTGSRYYDDYNVEFAAPVHALMQDGRLTGFDGTRADVARAEAQYDRVARTFNIDRNAVHSWHAGIHPGCGYYWDIHENFERWGGAAFGNPRILHFHTCGAYAPGEISWNVIDPTIEVDGVTLWDRGVLRAERLPNGPEILAQYPCAAALFEAPDPEIGLVPPWQAELATRGQGGGLKDRGPGA